MVSSATAEETRAVLMLSQAFPPRQAAGTFRVIRFTRFLPELGWKCVVVTPRVQCHPGLDETLVEQIDPATEVVRFGCGDPAEHLRRWVTLRRDLVGRLTRKPARVLSRLMDKVLLPDTRVLGTRRLFRACTRVFARRRVDVVWITGPPFSYFRIVPRLKKAFGVPVVLDLRDPWTTGDLRYQGRDRWRLKHERRMEGEAFALADRVVLNSELCHRAYCRLYPDLPADRWAVLTNGYDPEEFVDVLPEPFDRMVLVHGGLSGGNRTARWLIQAMGILCKAGVLSPASFRYVSYGSGGPEEHEAAVAGGVADMVEFRGSRSHKEVLSAVKGAGALLLIVGSGHETSIPGKLYEYLGAGRPVIMAGAPDCAAADVIRETGVGRVVALNDVEGLADCLRDLVLGRLASHRDEGRVRAYESRSISRRLADLLRSVMDGPA
ncbi:MAG: glycosyltransferase [Phycisphaerae bacterium]|nr:glycosyltransferase [Phycisphaerae bacterium]